MFGKLMNKSETKQPKIIICNRTYAPILVSFIKIDGLLNIQAASGIASLFTLILTPLMLISPLGMMVRVYLVSLAFSSLLDVRRLAFCS